MFFLLSSDGFSVRFSPLALKWSSEIKCSECLLWPWIFLLYGFAKKNEAWIHHMLIFHAIRSACVAAFYLFSPLISTSRECVFAKIVCMALCEHKRIDRIDRFYYLSTWWWRSTIHRHSLAFFSALVARKNKRFNEILREPRASQTYRYSVRLSS